LKPDNQKKFSLGGDGTGVKNQLCPSRAEIFLGLSIEKSTLRSDAQIRRIFLIGYGANAIHPVDDK
jgi:hypothetical protein